MAFKKQMVQVVYFVTFKMDFEDHLVYQIQQENFYNFIPSSKIAAVAAVELKIPILTPEIQSSCDKLPVPFPLKPHCNTPREKFHFRISFYSVNHYF